MLNDVLVHKVHLTKESLSKTLKLKPEDHDHSKTIGDFLFPRMNEFE